MYSCCRRIVGLADSGGGGVRFSVRSGLWETATDPPQQCEFLSRISSLQRTPSARGLSTMSSILGVVRKQLKSHPAVSPEHSAFLDRVRDPVTLKALGRTRCGQARARSLKSHLNYLMCHHLLLLSVADAASLS